MGRPPKPKIIEPARSRGRPPLPLSRDPERYFLALLSAHIEIGRLSGISECRVLDSFAGAREGEPIEQEDLNCLIQLALTDQSCGPRERRKLAVIERRGADGLVGLPKWKQGKKGSEWHSMNAFRPLADSYRRKLNVIRVKPPSDPDWMWLDRMTAAWRICLTGQIASARMAELLTSLLGENEHFDAVMRPVLRVRASQRMAGLKQAEASPDFLRNLIRGTL
jgi:hypothetical protein